MLLLVVLVVVVVVVVAVRVVVAVVTGCSRSKSPVVDLPSLLILAVGC